MALVVYFDEVGNPTLDVTDKDFPVFAIALFICDSDCYVNEITPRVNRLKFKWFGHEGVILHSRKNEDRQLHVAFQRIVTLGSGYIDAARFRKINFTLRFLPKAMNIIGTQMADLAAYPVARRVLDAKKPNPASTS